MTGEPTAAAPPLKLARPSIVLAGARAGSEEGDAAGLGGSGAAGLIARRSLACARWVGSSSVKPPGAPPTAGEDGTSTPIEMPITVRCGTRPPVDALGSLPDCAGTFCCEPRCAGTFCCEPRCAGTFCCEPPWAGTPCWEIGRCASRGIAWFALEASLPSNIEFRIIIVRSLESAGSTPDAGAAANGDGVGF